MPKSEVKKRGGSVRTRTKSLPGGKYMTCEVTRKPGPQGGRTVCSKPKKAKGKR